jgi:hypothetical protein
VDRQMDRSRLRRVEADDRALPGEDVCPTFRLRATAGLMPPQQPRLIARPLAAVSAA